MVEEPVEILVHLAEKGEIDPWNIDIVEVTDRFLAELDRRKELDLRISGRTLFYAALLLRMKSEYLGILDMEDEAGFEEDMEGLDEFGLPGVFGEGGSLGPIEQLEHEIRRRLERKHLRKRPVTLFELILELKDAEKEQRRKQRFRSPIGDLIDIDDVVNIAHEEGYREAAISVMGQCEERLSEEEVMTLHELAELLGKSIAEVYIPLLFLMFEGKLAIWQDEFFGEIFVQACRAEE
ncbi:MAG TPA: ScpA family protein [Methanoregulaceae archaeon]|nr:ScpA family protein [Methanoregulaceae archaeon]